MKNCVECHKNRPDIMYVIEGNPSLHSICQSCRVMLELKHNIRRSHYFHPNVKKLWG